MEITEPELNGMPTVELLRVVDRSHTETKVLAERLEEYRSCLLRMRSDLQLLKQDIL